MKKEFFQELMNMVMFRKFTTTVSFLRKETLNDQDLKEAIKSLKREGILDAIKNSNQDPQEIADIALKAFDESVKKARERFENLSNQLVDYIQKNKME